MADLKTLTAEIASSYLANNKVGAGDVAGVIANVYASLVDVEAGPAAQVEETEARPTAAQIRKSVQPDHLDCLICGRPFRTIKRHLANAHGLTPEEYRAKLGLRAEYPLSAPSYSAYRAQWAKDAGLGKSVRGVRSQAAAVIAAPAVANAAKVTVAAPVAKTKTVVAASPVAKTKPTPKPKVRKVASTAADKPRVKPAKASKSPGAIDPSEDDFT